MHMPERASLLHRLGSVVHLQMHERVDIVSCQVVHYARLLTRRCRHVCPQRIC